MGATQSVIRVCVAEKDKSNLHMGKNIWKLNHRIMSNCVADKKGEKYLL